ncbi:hypothetical protein LX32DRAFT_41776 [Colletotrichum zoysiae]|uniref:Uncharacterized protein n=1 Tax=Colletotrichum zoysiae TaxID=1216348 RepID=A0AAD9HSK5_9PEZI|nr:hypothetical protein LX32DRAFT_41776 [Colletotrichum zoysiae]
MQRYTILTQTTDTLLRKQYVERRGGAEIKAKQIPIVVQAPRGAAESHRCSIAILRQGYRARVRLTGVDTPVGLRRELNPVAVTLQTLAAIKPIAGCSQSVARLRRTDSSGKGAVPDTTYPSMGEGEGNTGPFNAPPSSWHRTGPSVPFGMPYGYTTVGFAHPVPPQLVERGLLNEGVPAESTGIPLLRAPQRVNAHPFGWLASCPSLPTLGTDQRVSSVRLSIKMSL